MDFSSNSASKLAPNQPVTILANNSNNNTQFPQPSIKILKRPASDKRLSDLANPNANRLVLFYEFQIKLLPLESIDSLRTLKLFFKKFDLLLNTLIISSNYFAYLYWGFFLAKKSRKKALVLDIFC